MCLILFFGSLFPTRKYTDACIEVGGELKKEAELRTLRVLVVEER